MAFKFANRVKETTSTTGTGSVDLDGAVTGYNPFSEEMNNADETVYLIVDDPDNPTEYELGRGTLTTGSPDSLSRDTVIDSSNGGSKINLQSGTTYTVVATIAAEVLSDSGLKGIKVFTASGTWTKPANLRRVIVTVIGGGGAGGGAEDVAGELSVGSGGGAGGVAKALIEAADLGATETVTIGSTATGNSAAAGDNGGTASFGSHASATGGAGGTVINANNTTVQNAKKGGDAGTGTVATGTEIASGGGDNGGWAQRENISTSGAGGSLPPYGTGGNLIDGSSSNGNDATGYGAGGGGARDNGTANRSGGDGAPPLVIVEEYGP